MFIIFIGFKPALEGRAVVNLQMSNTFAAFQDICESIKVSPTAELLTNRGVINQVILRVISLYKWNYVIYILSWGDIVMYRIEKKINSTKNP